MVDDAQLAGEATEGSSAFSPARSRRSRKAFAAHGLTLLPGKARRLTSSREPVVCQGSRPKRAGPQAHGLNGSGFEEAQFAERVIGLIAGRDRTLRLHPHAARREHLRQITVNTLGTGNLRDAVTLPDGEDEREWVSMKLVDHFNDCQMVYCLVNDCCTEAACPTCTAGPSVSFRWAADGGREHKAPERETQRARLS